MPSPPRLRARSRIEALRGHRRIGLLALLFGLATSPVPPRRTRDRWYVPAAPVAEALWSDLTFDPATLSVTTVSSITGSTLEYAGTTGEGLRDHAYAISMAPGLPIGTSQADLLLPLELVEVLFDVTASVTPWEDEIHLVSRRLAHSLSDVPGFGMREIAYRGWALADGLTRPGRLR